MTPEEKVSRIFFQFNAKTVMQEPYQHHAHMAKAKQSTIICIKEILEAIQGNSKDFAFTKKYWLEALEIAKHLKH